MDTKDGVAAYSEDGSLTREQAELLSRLEGLFRELSPARQRLLIRQLRADDWSGDDLPAVVNLPRMESGGADSFTPSE